MSHQRIEVLGNPTPLVNKGDRECWSKENIEDGKRRILSCDGGGMRGLITAVVLAKMEKDLQEHYGEEYRLGHYFDVVGGSSTGSILATWIALGLKMQDCVDLYRSKEGAELFIPARPICNRIPFIGNLVNTILTKYKAEKLEETIQKRVKDVKMNSSSGLFLCDLIICAKNMTTRRTIFVNSHPESKWFGVTKDLLVRDLVRGSSAAPTYFPPKKLHINNKPVELVDGGVSYNNPSFPIFIECFIVIIA